MDRNVQRLLNRVSLCFATLATLALLNLYSRSSFYCPSAFAAAHRRYQSLNLAGDPFPRSSCDAAARDRLSPEKRFAKLSASRAFRRRADAFAALFARLRSIGLLSNSSHVLCVAAGAGHEVAALKDSGIGEVIGVDLLDFPPLVSRADPHNLPFFDEVFDLGFTAGLAGALFPARFAAEMERTVRPGCGVVLAVERWWSTGEVEEVKALFRKSSLVEVRNVTFLGAETTLIIMKKNGESPP